jgi:hypothetical protein
VSWDAAAMPDDFDDAASGKFAPLSDAGLSATRNVSFLARGGERGIAVGQK